MADMVNHPLHYTMGKVEVIDVIDGVCKDINDPSVAYSIGNVLKYVLRSPYKDNMYQDLKKAVWYLNHAISLMEDNYGEFDDEQIEDEENIDLDIQTTFNDDITNEGFEEIIQEE